jgi:hypothetical protein
MKRMTLVASLIVFALTHHPVVVAQSPSGASPRPAFEVATVRPNKSGEMRVSMRLIPGGAYEAFNVTLGAMIRLAYRLQDFQVVGAPACTCARDRLRVAADRELSPRGFPRH